MQAGKAATTDGHHIIAHRIDTAEQNLYTTHTYVYRPLRVRIAKYDRKGPSHTPRQHIHIYIKKDLYQNLASGTTELSKIAERES